MARTEFVNFPDIQKNSARCVPALLNSIIDISFVEEKHLSNLSTLFFTDTLIYFPVSPQTSKYVKDRKYRVIEMEYTINLMNTEDTLQPSATLC